MCKEVECRYLECLDKLEECVSNMKAMNRRLETLSSIVSIGSIVLDIESNINNIRRELEEDILDGETEE